MERRAQIKQVDVKTHRNYGRYYLQDGYKLSRRSWKTLKGAMLARQKMENGKMKINWIW